MWKKNESDEELTEQDLMPINPPMTKSRSREPATIGPSISIRGDLAGDEDLIIQGRVEGTVSLQQNNLTIGKEGRVKANVFGRIIKVEGQVEGDLNGAEQVIVQESGNVRGNIIAPRVALEDGSRFKGSIDMDVKNGEPRTAGINVSGIKSAIGASKDELGRSGLDKKSEQTAKAK